MINPETHEVEALHKGTLVYHYEAHIVVEDMDPSTGDEPEE